jgi:integrase
MARRKPAAPFWRKQTRCYYVKVGGKMVRLGADHDEAFRLYHEMKARPPEAPAPPPKPGELLVVRLFEDYMIWVEANRSPRTLQAYQGLIQQFLKGIPRTLAVADLRPFHVTRIMDARAERWSPNHRANFATAVLGAFNWAETQGLIDLNPIRHLPRPGRQARELAVSPEQHAIMLAAATSPQFRDLIELAWETGLRPQEVRAIEARHVDRRKWQIVFPRSEAKGKRAIRVIYLATDKAREIVARHCDAHPSGPILLNTLGRPWTACSIGHTFARMAAKTGIKLHMGAYRKGFVTEALKNGVDTVTLAHLVGHANATMISSVYGKVHQDPSHMAEAARRAKGGVNPTGRSGT